MIWAMFLSVCFGLVTLATVYRQLSDFGQCLQLFFFLFWLCNLGHSYSCQ